MNSAPFGVVVLRDRRGKQIGWRAVWNDPPGVQKSKRFLFRDYGNRAYAVALQYRLAQVSRVIQKRRRDRAFNT